MPMISVVMPVYNGERFIRPAIESIQRQSVTDFELLVVDDGSRDSTADIVREYSANDSRVRLLQNPKNLMIVESLNRGVDVAKGEYLARMDADDIAFPNRFERQLAQIDKLKVDVVSSSYQQIDDMGRVARKRKLLGYDMNSDELKVLLGVANIILHPSVFGKCAIFKKYLYSNDDDCKYCEDTELWMRMLAHGVRFFSSKEQLLYYRRGMTSVSVNHFKTQSKNNMRLALSWQNSLNRPVIPDGAFEIISGRAQASVGMHQWREACSALENYFNSKTDHVDIQMLRKWIIQKELSLSVNIPGGRFLKCRRLISTITRIPYIIAMK